jgi:hypothetical protein
MVGFVPGVPVSLNGLAPDRNRQKPPDPLETRVSGTKQGQRDPRSFPVERVHSQPYASTALPLVRTPSLDTRTPGRAAPQPDAS